MHQPVDDDTDLTRAFSARLMQVGPVKLALECQVLATLALHMVNNALMGEDEQDEPDWAEGLEHEPAQ